MFIAVMARGAAAQFKARARCVCGQQRRCCDLTCVVMRRQCAPPVVWCGALACCSSSGAVRRQHPQALSAQVATGTIAAVLCFMKPSTPLYAVDDLNDVPDVVGQLLGAAKRAAGARLELVADTVTNTAGGLGREVSMLLFAVAAALLAVVCVCAGASALLSTSLGWGWALVLVGAVQLAISAVIARLALRTMATL